MKKNRIKSDSSSTIPLIFRYVCSICKERFLFLSSLTKNKEGKEVCENCLRKEQSEEKINCNL